MEWIWVWLISANVVAGWALAKASFANGRLDILEKILVDVCEEMHPGSTAAFRARKGD